MDISLEEMTWPPKLLHGSNHLRFRTVVDEVAAWEPEPWSGRQGFDGGERLLGDNLQQRVREEILHTTGAAIQKTTGAMVQLREQSGMLGETTPNGSGVMARGLCSR